MKKVLTALLFFATCLSTQAQSYHHLQARHTPEWFSEGISYQIVPRNFSAEGTLKGAEAQLERLKALGVNVVYLFPVNKADDDMDKSKWSPRQIKSGFNDPRNPYRAGDYFHVDPEYGTDQDLKDFIDHAHELGLKVFVDLVFCHCGPSAQVVRQHPDYFKHDKDGNMMLTRWHFPMFDHNNGATRAYLRSIMTYYVADFNVDGFRCDVADEVPIDFWEEARGELDLLNRDLVIVAEGKAVYNTRYAFDASYGWAISKEMGRILRLKDFAEKNGGAEYIRHCHEGYMGMCPKSTLLWHMTENHDWATDDFDNRKEKVFGHANQELGLAFLFAIDGVPFLFNGQEICYDKRLSLFGHGDFWIDWDEDSKSDYAQDRIAKIQKWASWRRDYTSLAHGETTWIDNDCPFEVCSFLRHDGKSADFLFVGNYSDKTVKVKLADGRKFNLAPWGYVFEPVKR